MGPFWVSFLEKETTMVEKNTIENFCNR